MASVASFPYEALAVKRYKSPHKNDLSFAKGDRILVLCAAPKDEDEEDDDDDEEQDQWLVGETLDGSKSGTFPASHVELAPPATSSKESTTSTTATSSTMKSPVVSSVVEDSQSQVSSSSMEKESSAPSEAPAKDVAPEKHVERQTNTEADSATDMATGDLETVTIPAAEKEVASVPIRAKAEAALAAPAPERKLSSPPLAPKPSGLAARIAAFNKPQEAPPPLPKGKPGAWKRPVPAPGAPKPVMPGLPPAQQTSTVNQAAGSKAGQVAATPPVNAEEKSTEADSERNSSGFSAADAQSSIKMSLKERMAALQRGDTADSSSSKAAPPPKAAPGKIAESKRTAAMAGVGVSSSKAEETTATSTEESVALDSEAALMEAAESKEATQPEVTVIEPAAENTGEAGADDEQTEEDKESERRAAIARRMAALGGRRMGGGPALFGAPAPAKKVSAESASSVPELRSDEAPSEEQTPIVPSTDTVNGEGGQLVESAKTLAVPRRAAPPRKKKSSASSGHAAEAIPERQGTDSAPGEAITPVVKETASSDPGEPHVSSTGTDTTEKGASGGDFTKLGIATGAGAAVGGAAVLVDEAKPLHEEPAEVEGAANEVASSYGDMTSDFEPSTPISDRQMDENARKLEEFVRTPQDERISNMDAQDEDDQDKPEEEESYAPIPAPAPSAPPLAAPDSAIPRPPSSRPPSTRPPVPKTSLPLDEEVNHRTLSPPPTRAPPIPSFGGQAAIVDDRMPHSTELGSTQAESSVMEARPTIMATPKPRMAVPAEVSDDEGDEEEKAEIAPLSAQTDQTVPEAEGQAEEMTEEEEERQRKARIAAKMARMGGQPIMGAPLMFKKPQTSAPLSSEPQIDERDNSVEAVEDVSAKQSEPPTARAPSIPPPSSPPPIPSTSPPPIRSMSGAPPIPTKSPPPPVPNTSSLERKLSQISMSNEDSLGRRGSLLSRSSEMSAGHPRKISMAESDDQIMERDDVREGMATPPPAPVSPPPRAPPSRAPPSTKAPSAVHSGSLPFQSAATANDAPAKEVSHARSASVKRMSQAGPRSSRDLDLMPSSQWWRHGRPVKLPPSLLRPDALPIISTQDDGPRHHVRVELVFEDYSSTIVLVQYEDDDAAEEATGLSQQHNFAPPRPSTQELQSWSQQYGGPVAKQAAASLQAKSIVGDGTSKGFITALLASSPGHNDVLPSVGSSFGSIILAQAATTAVDMGADEIRAGDIVALHGVDLKGKRGLTPYHATFGSAQDPTYGCIIESDSKKKKLRCILVPGVEGKRGRGPEEVSLRLDDVKSGLLRIFRLAPKSGWLSS